MRAFTMEPADLYDPYREAADEAELALAAWWSATGRRRREAYAVYRAAAEREYAAAIAWLKACRDYDAAVSTRQACSPSIVG